MSPRQNSIDQYMTSYTGLQHQRLEEMRSIIRLVMSDAQEGIHYNISAFQKDNIWVIYFSVHTNHISLSFYPTEDTYSKFAEELKLYKHSKSAIQFPLDQELPTKLICDIINYALPIILLAKKSLKDKK